MIQGQWFFIAGALPPFKPFVLPPPLPLPSPFGATTQILAIIDLNFLTICIVHVHVSGPSRQN